MSINSDLTRGVAEPIILNLLTGKMMYGYEIIREVNRRSGGVFEWKEGSLYPCLHRLEAQKLICSSWSTAEAKPRKYYAITTEGEKALCCKKKEVNEFVGALTMLMA